MTEKKHYFSERYAIFTDCACLLKTFLEVFNSDKLTASNSSKKFRSLNSKFPDANKKPKEYNCTVQEYKSLFSSFLRFMFS